MATKDKSEVLRAADEEESPNVDLDPGHTEDEEEAPETPEELPKKFGTDNTVVKVTNKGERVFSDFIDRDGGDTYEGMSASMADIDVPDEDGGDVGGLDDPGKYQYDDVTQRFPVGTQTVSIGASGGTQWLLLWKYVAKTVTPKGTKKSHKVYSFVHEKKYKNLSEMPAAHKKIWTERGFWYNGKKVTPAE